MTKQTKVQKQIEKIERENARRLAKLLERLNKTMTVKAWDYRYNWNTRKAQGE
jgi:hypothetical protein